MQALLAMADAEIGPEEAQHRHSIIHLTTSIHDMTGRIAEAEDTTFAAIVREAAMLIRSLRGAGPMRPIYGALNVTVIIEHKQAGTRRSEVRMLGAVWLSRTSSSRSAFAPSSIPAPSRTGHQLSEMEVEMFARRLLQESDGAPLWVFAYGSLIWKPDFDAVEWQRGAPRGWHRSFCLKMTRRRGSRAQPGLMMALERGGRCNGILFRLADDDRLGQFPP